MNDRRILTYVKKIVLYENIYYVILTKKNCLFFKAGWCLCFLNNMFYEFYCIYRVWFVLRVTNPEMLHCF